MLDVTKQALPGHDPGFMGEKKAMVAQCEQRKLSREVRNCLMKAKTLPELGACQGQPKPAQPAPAPAPTPAPPAGSDQGSAAPAPTGSGGG